MATPLIGAGSRRSGSSEPAARARKSVSAFRSIAVDQPDPHFVRYLSEPAKRSLRSLAEMRDKQEETNIPCSVRLACHTCTLLG
ncbi:uncharacterized protein L969DRAFT_44435 [Mixia osmundae IAM 14324]|uniref:Uncharacterized protein n=1 Tax=Mixia osmundae (strain CBS 9802 / IAM 14324 / JCM 22182 / KY 12970) TaxID=764103 RepID=G7E3Q5_MIXOS|nr:uncharacterized protein L969DRAFT_44435 [Mixia osmundae IAM 14324]KEI41875.1 hypothetical protein L969DRAFT_44435 [Mixia osmundae IAM 14324]GAA97465.1 hypothetical protein E5Q_04144 [Mixia osmundae IAM 14324]